MIKQIFFGVFFLFSGSLFCQIYGELNIPAKRNEMPNWAKLMYDEPINFIQLAKEYRSYYKEKQQEKQHKVKRIAIEGKFGQGKRAYGLNKIMTKLPETSVAYICAACLVMNLLTLLRRFLVPLQNIANYLKYIINYKQYTHRSTRH